MTSDKDKPDEQLQRTLPDINQAEKEQEAGEYRPWDDGFRVSMLLLLVIGLPLFLASLYFVLYAVFTR